MDVFNRGVCLIAATVVAVAVQAAEFSLEECHSKAAAGNAEAQWQLGQRYENGQGVRKSAIRAIAQYKKAAEQKHRRACERLSKFYADGIIVGKDAVLAAKYRAMATGEDVSVAAKEAAATEKATNEDEIETALDYILGRKGHKRDAKAGIRILYAAAKDKPVAQRVFVDRWSKGDLDGALDQLSDEEWKDLIPWYEDAWTSGNKRAGLILGNDAYYRKRYSLALSYWEESGLAKCWYFVGRFYDSWSEEGKGGGPKHMKDETKARKAYEKCLRLDKTWDDARFNLGLIYLFAKKDSNVNFQEALNIFAYFIKKIPDDKWTNYNYGLAGYCNVKERFGKSYDVYKRKVHKNIYGEDQDYNSNYTKSKMQAEFNQAKSEIKRYVSHIRKAASMGCEPAKKFMQEYKEVD